MQRITYFCILLFCIGCDTGGTVEQGKECPFKEVYSFEKEDEKVKSNRLTGDLAVSIGQNLKRLTGIEITGSLEGDILNIQEKFYAKEYANYTVEFVEKHNAYINVICGIHSLMQGQEELELPKTDLEKRFFTAIEDYVDFLKGNVQPKPETVEEEESKEENENTSSEESKTKKPQVKKSKAEEAKMVDHAPKETILRSVTFRTEPEQAEIYLNGSFEGISNRSLNLPLRDYDILIKKEGYFDLRDKLILPPEGSARLLFYELEKKGNDDE